MLKILVMIQMQTKYSTKIGEKKTKNRKLYKTEYCGKKNKKEDDLF